MGGKYHIRTNEVRDFGDTTDYYIDSLLKVLKILVTKKKHIIFVTKHYYI